MGLLSNIDGREPDFVNELGVKWWLDEGTTGYARNPDHTGTVLDAACYLVEEPDGSRTRVLVVDGAAEFENPRMEDMAVHIDMLKMLARSLEGK